MMVIWMLSYDYGDPLCSCIAMILEHVGSVWVWNFVSAIKGET
jgi:hypothetical protein